MADFEAEQQGSQSSAKGPAALTPRPGAIDGSARVFCARCGYDLTGSMVGGTCPECGTTVAQSLRHSGLGAGGPTSGYAVAALVLGLLALVSCPAYGVPTLVLGPLAILFAVLAQRQVRSGEAAGPTGGLATAGLVCGLIGLILSGLMWLFIVGMVLLTFLTQP